MGYIDKNYNMEILDTITVQPKIDIECNKLNSNANLNRFFTLRKHHIHQKVHKSFLIRGRLNNGSSKWLNQKIILSS
jgi:hypothetical protein